MSSLEYWDKESKLFRAFILRLIFFTALPSVGLFTWAGITMLKTGFSWLIAIGPFVYFAATAITLFVLYRREERKIR